MNEKTLIITVIASLIIFPSSLYAQEELQITPEPSPSIEVTVTPTPEVTVISTGDTESKTDIVNVINTNTIGSICAHIMNDFTKENEDINLSYAGNQNCILPAPSITAVPKEATESGTLEIAQQNEAKVETVLVVVAETGNNIAEGDNVEITTGDATAEANIVNVVNTNLVGNNGHFTVLNLFDSHDGNITLPNENQFVSGQTIPVFDSSFLTIHNTNVLSLQNKVNADVNTGNNTAMGENTNIKTGDAHVSIQILDKLNTNMVASNFFILDINTFGTWDGTLEGWSGHIMQNGNTLRAYAFMEPYDRNLKHDTSFISNTNSADVTNDINIQANTGNNTAVGNDTDITTGNAEADVSIFNFINTTIIGDNWFYYIINIFDTLQGNIQFAKAEEPEIAKTETNQNDQVANIPDKQIDTKANTTQIITYIDKEEPVLIDAEIIQTSYVPIQSPISEEAYVAPKQFKTGQVIGTYNEPKQALAVPSILLWYMGGLGIFVIRSLVSAD